MALYLNVILNVNAYFKKTEKALICDQILPVKYLDYLKCESNAIFTESFS